MECSVGQKNLPVFQTQETASLKERVGEGWPERLWKTVKSARVEAKGLDTVLLSS